MSRLKYFGMWLLIIIAFYLFSTGITYLYMHGDEVRGTVYNMIHHEQVVENK